MAEKPVSIPFPVALDKFGVELQSAIRNFQKEGVLKTALIADLVKIYGAVFWMQQLFATFFNAHMEDYNYFTKNYEELKKKFEELETKTAGYSSEINTFRGRIAKQEEKPTQG